MKITTAQMLKILYVFAWIIFVGLCIEAGGFIFNAVYTVTVNPSGAGHFWEKIDLSGLYSYDVGHYLVQTFFMTLVGLMKALLFYLIIKLLHDKKLNMENPFNKEVGSFIFNVSYLSLFIGGFSHWGAEYAQWFVSKDIAMPDAQFLGLGGADVWLFMGVVLLIIAQIFKRGIELQEENELTV
ncbi:DUF2975 domain-containing protein [Flavobacterium sp. Sd200]|uniref:DUF2975 domain-containing protein n=1 Tax=Flavobacterium sp. Sd200 TaxID=2692211 RepID=UPI001368C73E|nr:DUF2975 domain-containing protein [Flavobacterium sp. Sd200]MXN89893.1 DUF2975 domain-containing protein [Flavobacterium sp. Sd200]